MTVSGVAALAADERRSARNDVRLAATLRAGPTVHSVVVFNVSAHGVMAEMDATLPPGRPVIVELEGLAPTRGRVAWVRQGHLGVAFDAPLTLSALLAIV